MPSLALASVSLRNAATGLDITVFDIDPETYEPFNVARRGSIHPTLDGGSIFQDFGLQERDWSLNIGGQLTDIDTLTALWTKYRASGTEWEWRDWYGNRFRVVFTPGTQGFRPVPIRGSCEAFTYTMNLTVCDVLAWFGGAY